MCGRSAPLLKARIEGSELDVCEGCARFGKVLAQPKVPRLAKKQHAQRQNPEELFSLVDDYAKRIRAARETLGLLQEEFAKKVAERHSLMQKIEAGSIKPSLPLARKLENMLHLKLLIPVPGSAETSNSSRNKDAHFTIADFVKQK